MHALIAGPRWSDQGSLTTAIEIFLLVPRCCSRSVDFGALFRPKEIESGV
jgi:hypothetical protein